MDVRLRLLQLLDVRVGMAKDRRNSVELELDEVDKYLTNVFPRSTLKTVKDGTDVVRFWLSNEQAFPALTKLVLRFYATPVPSTTSERNFSYVNRIVMPSRSTMNTDVVCDLLFCRSALNAQPLPQKREE